MSQPNEEVVKKLADDQQIALQQSNLNPSQQPKPLILSSQPYNANPQGGQVAASVRDLGVNVPVKAEVLTYKKGSTTDNSKTGNVNQEVQGDNHAPAISGKQDNSKTTICRIS